MDASELGMLVTLDALLQESSVSGAARKLGLSTPAVSHALARLRERFDDPLLVRAGRGMVLTPRAEVLRPRVREVVQLGAQVFTASGQFDPAALTRAFRLSVTDYVLLVFGAGFEQLVQAQAPGLDLRFLPNSVDDAGMLRRGETDLAIGIYGALPPELKMRPIITERLVCVVRADHPTVGASLPLEAYVRLAHVQVAPRGQPGGYLDSVLAERGHVRRIARAVPFFQVALEMTARSDYILTVPERIARSMGRALGLRVLEVPLPLEPYALSMVWHPRFDGDAAHGWLRAQLVAATAQLQGIAHEGARRSLDEDDPTTGSAPRKRRS